MRFARKKLAPGASFRSETGTSVHENGHFLRHFEVRSCLSRNPRRTRYERHLESAAANNSCFSSSFTIRQSQIAPAAPKSPSYPVRAPFRGSRCRLHFGKKCIHSRHFGEAGAIYDWCIVIHCHLLATLKTGRFNYLSPMNVEFLIVPPCIKAFVLSWSCSHTE